MPVTPGSRRIIPSSHQLPVHSGSAAYTDEDGAVHPVNPELTLSPYWYQQRVPRNAENSKYFQPPHDYQLSGGLTNSMHAEPRAVIAVASRNNLTPTPYEGLVMILRGTGIDWFVSFKQPDMYHPEQWFWEASGHGWVFNERTARTPLSALNDFLGHLNSRRRTSLGYRLEE